MNTLTFMPVHRRPRERLREEGVEKLTLSELIAVILGSGSVQHDVLSLSCQIAEKLQVGETSFSTLCAIPGVGSAKAAMILAALQLGRQLQPYANQVYLRDPQAIYIACQDLLHLPQEKVVVFYLNARNQSLAREAVSVGTVASSLLHPRELFRPAILHNASAIVLAHNHPSGDPEPSQADLDATKSIQKAGECVGIELVDHVICASRGFVSLRATNPKLFSGH